MENNWAIVSDPISKTVCVGFRYYRQTGIYRFKNYNEYKTLVKKLKEMLRFDVNKKLKKG